MDREQDDQTALLRARDFWGALALIGLSLFFLWRTLDIPLWGGNRAGVSAAAWYNSAAIVPLGIFAGLLVLSIVLLVIAIRSGGAKAALSSAGIGWNTDEAWRFVTLAIILFFYVAGLVPRVDFILCSGLLITALTYGYRGGVRSRMTIAAVAVALCGSYALLRHLPQAQWAAHDDDWLTLLAWLALTGKALMHSKHDRVLRILPIISVLAPLFLVCAMAFGFRQNVPNRGGLLFKQIEYHYFVTIRPIWRS